jgi:hypothetical protein
VRARNLKPGFFKNEILCSIQPTTRILFAGLWCLADRSGRLEDRPKRIKAEVLPYDDCDVDILLGDLMQTEFINRYEVNGCKYIEIINFTKHQSPHIKESDSTIPSPNEHHKNTKKTRGSFGVKTPDSPYPHSLTPDSPYPDSLLSSFNVFWKIYPKKIGKGYAFKMWRKIKPDDTLLKKMVDKIELFKQTEQWQKDGGQFIPHPATWLNQERWEDEPLHPQIKGFGAEKKWLKMQEEKDETRRQEQILIGNGKNKSLSSER